jgi:transposase
MLTTKEIHDLFGFSMSTVTYWVRNNKLKAEKVEKPVKNGGEMYYFNEEEVREFLYQKKEEYQTKIANLQEKVDNIEAFI